MNQVACCHLQQSYKRCLQIPGEDSILLLDIELKLRKKDFGNEGLSCCKHKEDFWAQGISPKHMYSPGKHTQASTTKEKILVRSWSLWQEEQIPKLHHCQEGCHLQQSTEFFL